MQPSTIFDIPTPSLVLNRTKLVRNIDRMAAACKRNDVALRPHLKTAKCIDVARMVLAGQDDRIAVSTLREAEYFAENGLKDIQYAVCILPDKLERVVEIQKTGATVTLITDCPRVARDIAGKGASLNTVFHVQIEIDCGENRTGVFAESGDLIEIARILDGSSHVVFSGIMTHAGHSYACRNLDEIEETAEAERKTALAAADRVRDLGIACPAVSVGSTPTALHARNLDGITETRAGVYMFGDMFQAQIGSCGVEDLAVSVLTEVTSQRAELNRLLLDAGALALSKDRSTQNTPNDVGYGLLGDVDGRVISPQLDISRVFQEHGVVHVPNAAALDRYPIGTRMRIFPNHVCMTAAMYEHYYVVDDDIGDGTEIVAIWNRANGW